MNPLTLFIVSGLIVVAVMLFSTIVWMRITRRLPASQKKAGRLFTLCFLLYALGQGVALFGGLMQLGGLWWDMPNYCYGLAALLFAAGSWIFYKGQQERA